MGKKSRNKSTAIVKPRIGVPLNIKHLGKPLYVVGTILDTVEVLEAWKQNTEEGIFTALPETLEVFPIDDIPAGEKGKSLGLIIFTTPELVGEENNNVTGEFLPFLVGEAVGWRNPKIGHLIQEEDSVLESLKTAATFYSDKFPGYDNIFRVEEVIDPMGWSSTLVLRIDNQIKSL